MDYMYLAQVPGKQMGLHLFSSSPAQIEKFKWTCKDQLSKELSWFHQSNCDNYQFFEFWKNKNHDLMLSEAMKIAEELDCELHLEVISTSKVREILQCTAADAVEARQALR